MTTNSVKTFMLLALMSGLVLVIGGVAGGRIGLMIAVGIALVMNIGGYWFSAKMALSAYSARELSPEAAPMLHAMVAELAHNAGVPKPRVYIIPEESPNAFATGRNPENAAVAVTEGIVRMLSPDELRGVIAHEISHIANRDILVQCIAGLLATVIMYLANMAQFAAIFGGGRSSDGENSSSNPIALILMAVLAPLAATLIKFAISRSREYMADEKGAQISGSPHALASALAKISEYSKRIHMQRGNQATAHMFIINPFSSGGLQSLFSTHPPVEERIARLEAMRR